jgi:hypothetical protein
MAAATARLNATVLLPSSEIAEVTTTVFTSPPTWR